MTVTERRDAPDWAYADPDESCVVYEDVVRLNHTDAFGVHYWGAAPVWAQRGLEEIFLRWGRPLGEYVGGDLDYFVRRATVDYLAPLTLGTSVRVVSRIVRVGRTSFTAGTSVGANGRPALVIEQTFVCFNRVGMTTQPVEEWLRALGPEPA